MTDDGDLTPDSSEDADEVLLPGDEYVDFDEGCRTRGIEAEEALISPTR